MEKKLVKLVDFIKDNGLTFMGTDSGLNSDCVLLSGFALYIGERDIDVLVAAVYAARSNPVKTVVGFEFELERVFKYAELNDYGLWWNGEDAEIMYVF